LFGPPWCQACSKATNPLLLPYVGPYAPHQRALGTRVFECHTLLKKLGALTQAPATAAASEPPPPVTPAPTQFGDHATRVTVVTWFSSTDACERRCGGDSGNLTSPTPQAARRGAEAIAVSLSGVFVTLVLAYPVSAHLPYANRDAQQPRMKSSRAPLPVVCMRGSTCWPMCPSNASWWQCAPQRTRLPWMRTWILQVLRMLTRTAHGSVVVASTLSVVMA